MQFPLATLLLKEFLQGLFIGFSKQTVALLNEVGASFGSFDILGDEEIRQGLKVRSAVSLGFYNSNELVLFHYFFV